MTSYKPDMSNPRLIEDACSEFMSAESTRRHYSAMALSSNKDNKNEKDKDNKGSRRGQNKDNGKDKGNNKNDKDKEEP